MDTGVPGLLEEAYWDFAGNRARTLFETRVGESMLDDRGQPRLLLTRAVVDGPLRHGLRYLPLGD